MIKPFCNRGHPRIPENLSGKNCKICMAERGRKWNERNRANETKRKRQWYDDHLSEANERSRKWYLEHKEQESDKARKRYQANPDYYKRKSLERYWSDPVQAAERAKAYYQKNRDKATAHSHNRRAREITAAGTASSEQIDARMRYYGYHCVYCGGPFEHVEHAIPLARGGSNWPANLVPSCRSCNNRKHTKKWYEFI